GWRGAAGRGCSPGSDRGCYHVARADVAVGAGLMAREQVGNRVGRQRAREEEALPGVAPRLAELVELSGLLDALRDDREVEGVADADDGPHHDQPLVGALAQLVDERAVDLQEFNGD